MKRESINYLVAGGVVLGALALLLVVLYRITGRGGDSEGYHAYYERVGGIRYGTPVYFEGFKVGQVAQVVPEHDGVATRFRVELRVAAGWPIPADSLATISSSGLLSDVFIYIREGEAETALEPGATIDSEESADLFAALGDLAGEIEALTVSELTPLLELINERVDAITGDVQNGTPEIVSNARQMMARLNDSAAAVQSLLAEENRELLVQTFRNVERASMRTASLVEELLATREQFDALLAETHALVSENRPELSATVAELEATVSRLSRRIESTAFNLQEASRHFNEFTRIIRHSPNRLLFSPASDDPQEQEP